MTSRKILGLAIAYAVIASLDVVTTIWSQSLPWHTCPTNPNMMCGIVESNPLTASFLGSKLDFVTWIGFKMLPVPLCYFISAKGKLPTLMAVAFLLVASIGIGYLVINNILLGVIVN